jgi:error-prone DNA polymerase
MGIVKVDLLGLGMMAVLQDALTIINAGLEPARAAVAREAGRDDGTVGGRDVGRDFSPAGRGPSGPEPRVPSPDEVVGRDFSPAGSAVGDRSSPEPRAPRPGEGVGRDFSPAGRASQRPAASGESAHIDLAHLPPDDPLVYRMLQEADTIGIFQVESRAQMATLPRLKPANFYDLVVEVAIIRPGPIVGQMVHPYLSRRAGREPVEYAHPVLRPILERTLGVPLFQEQLLRMAMAVAGFTGGEAEELRRAMGFKRSEARMRKIEAKLRAGMAQNGITGETADDIVRSITSFALYGFPESHAASFALLVYASAYLKAYYPAAFYAALLNNQPMGFYHPATLVKDAQRHGVRFKAIDVQRSDWLCRVEADGAVRLGLLFVRGLREEVGRKIESVRGASCHVPGVREIPDHPVGCPKCGADGPAEAGHHGRTSMIEMLERTPAGVERWFCNVCAHDWTSDSTGGAGQDAGVSGSVAGRVAGRVVGRDFSPAEAAARGRTPCPEPRAPSPDSASRQPPAASRRFASLDALIAATGLRRDELAALAEIGALASFDFDRRGALWQIERAARPAGELFEQVDDEVPSASPLQPMTPAERVVADYAGTSLTIGPHPMALRRSELSLRGVLRASDLPRARAGRRVRIAGAVITRQRPGTAKGFAFLTLEDETGISNVIVRPDLFDTYRPVIVGEPFLLIEGVLQQQDGVTSIRADRLQPLGGLQPPIESHDFH